MNADVGSHGIPLSEATDPQNGFNRKTKDPRRPRGHFKAVGPVVDYAQQAIDIAKAEFYDKAGEDRDRSADRWGVMWVPET